MLDFEGSILIIPNCPGEPMVRWSEKDGVAIYRHMVIDDPAICEGCSYDNSDADVLGERTMYLMVPLHDPNGPEPLLEYCHNCVQECYDSWKKDPQSISHGQGGLVVWISGTADNSWKEVVS